MYTFEEKVVWVTGSSTGIGRAAAKAFANHGARVVVHCNRSKEEAMTLQDEINESGGDSLLVQGDVSDRHQVDDMVRQIKDKYAKLDILVNNAGSMVRRARLEEMDEDLWEQVMNVNLKSVFLVTKAALPLMKRQAKGRIINVTSIAARNGGGVGAFAYATSKGGVSTLTRALAKEFVEYNITVNGVGPGVITTPFQDRFNSAEMRQKFVDAIPMGREGTAEETVGALLFLASDYADYLTGEIIEVNGGQLMD